MTDTYSGVCRYCGQIKPIIAESQQQADEEISKKCDCNGAIREKRANRIKLNALEISTGEDERITKIIEKTGLMILDRYINQTSLSIGDVTYKVKENAAGQIKFTKKESKQQELQE